MEIRVPDITKIKEIKFKFPDLMAPDAEETIKLGYSTLLERETQLQNYRNKVRELEEEVKERKENWSKLLEIIDVTFEVKVSEYREHKANFSVFGCGNDSYGSVSYNK